MTYKSMSSVLLLWGLLHATSSFAALPITEKSFSIWEGQSAKDLYKIIVTQHQELKDPQCVGKYIQSLEHQAAISLGLTLITLDVKPSTKNYEFHFDYYAVDRRISSGKSFHFLNCERK